MDEHLRIGEGLARLQLLAPAGYALGLHISFTTPTFMFHTYPKKWRNQYAQNGFVLHDPSVRWGFENTGLIQWSALADQDDHGIFAKARAYEMNFGVTVSVESTGSRSLGGYARSDRAFTPKEEIELLDLTQVLHDMTATSRSLSPEVKTALKDLSFSVTKKGR